MLPIADEIHTFRQAGPCMFGADWDRDDLIAAMRAAPSIELSGPMATQIGHELVIKDATGWLFIQASQKRLEAPIT